MIDVAQQIEVFILDDRAVEDEVVRSAEALSETLQAEQLIQKAA